MPRTVVVLPARWTGVLPVGGGAGAAGRADRVYADHTVPDEVCAALGATRPGRRRTPDVLVTTDPTGTGDAAEVIAAADPPGAALLDAVAVMDRLRSPGGCPWDARADPPVAAALPGRGVLRALPGRSRTVIARRCARSSATCCCRCCSTPGSPPRATPAFDIDDVAADLVAKLVGRHPHVFAPSGVDTAERIDTAERQQHRWDELKRAEKQRESSVDGVPLGQPAVALAAKLVSRTARAGLPAELLPAGSGVGEQLFAAAAAAKLAGIDPEAELRTAARRFADAVRAAERAAADAGQDPHQLDAEAWAKYWPRSRHG